MNAGLAFDWTGMLAEQRAELVTELKAGGAPEALLETAEGYADTAGNLAAGAPVFLHGDLSCVNLVLDEDKVRVTGLVDFSDAKLGPADHEFISPVMNQFRGDTRVLCAFWEGAGITGDAALEKRAMARALLYYAEDMGRYLERLAPPVPASWPEAARRFWQLV